LHIALIPPVNFHRRILRAKPRELNFFIFPAAVFPSKEKRVFRQL
jgi:hypothetical protein